MTRFYARLLMLATALVLSACAGLLGPREVEFSQDKLQQSLARHFPLNKRILALFDINLGNPVLTLQPQSNRILTTMDASIAPPLAKNAWKGRFAVSGGLRFDPARNAIVLTDPRMENIELDGIDAGVSRQLAKLGRVLAEEILNGAVLYPLPPGELRYAGSRFVPGNIVVRSKSLAITLEPVK